MAIEWFTAGPTLLNSPLVLTVVAGIMGLFSGGALVALLKVGVDRQRIVVQAAQGAVLVQSSVIDDLQDELLRVQKQAERVRKENDELLHRIAILEQQVRNLEGEP